MHAQSTNMRRTENIVQFPILDTQRRRQARRLKPQEIGVRAPKTHLGRASSRVTIEIDPRPTVLGDLPFALISDAARETTGVRCLWRAMCPRGLPQGQKNPATDIHAGIVEILCTGVCSNSQVPLVLGLLSTMASAMKVSSLLVKVTA